MAEPPAVPPIIQTLVSPAAAAATDGHVGWNIIATPYAISTRSARSPTREPVTSATAAPISFRVAMPCGLIGAAQDPRRGLLLPDTRGCGWSQRSAA